MTTAATRGQARPRATVEADLIVLSSLKDVHSYDDAAHRRKETLHRVGKRFLRALAKDLGWSQGSYDVRSNAGGIAVSGEVTLHGEHLYVQLFESATGHSRISVLYRHCNGRKDYSGGVNQWSTVQRIGEDYDRFLAQCRAAAAGTLVHTTVLRAPMPMLG